MIRKRRVCMMILVLLGAFYLYKKIDYRHTKLDYKSRKHVANDCCQKITKECLACRWSMTVEEFCFRYSESIDCSICSTCEGLSKQRPRTENCPFKIMIAIALYPGQGISEFTWGVMNKYHRNINHTDVTIFPTHLFGGSESDIRNIYGSDVNVAPPTTPDKLLTTVLKTFTLSQHDILYFIKSDMIFLKHWNSFIQNNILQTDGYLSLYHPSYYHNTTADCENIQGKLCEGVPNGFEGFGVAMTQKFSILVLSNQYNMLNITKIFDERKIQFVYPAKSLAMHIGQDNQTESYCGLNMDPHRFARCELPKWIQDGVEFYSDRCTNPNERFRLGMNIADRFWSRPAVSFSLYGNKPRYTNLGLLNAKRMSSIYPGWKMWIFYDNTVNNQVLLDLCEYNIRFINMTGSPIKSKMSWRFLAASEPVGRFAVRDIDSWILARGKAAVDEWIQSGKKFHVMRDHPFHSRNAMNGGMWGGTHDAIPNMYELLLKRDMPHGYMLDMNFLHDVVWPIAKQSVWSHDSHATGQFGEVHPFPLEMHDPRFFVGSVN